MEVKVIAKIENRTFRQAAVLFDLDPPTDKEIKEMCEGTFDFNEVIDDNDQHQFNLGVACMVISRQMKKDDEKPKPKEKGKSKFQQRLEEAHKKQQEKNGN